jgi:hypothetical protein
MCDESELSFDSLGDDAPWSAALLALVARNAALQTTTLLRSRVFNDGDGTAARRRVAVAALRARLQAQLAARECRPPAPPSSAVAPAGSSRRLPESYAAAAPAAALAPRHRQRLARRPSRNAAAAAAAAPLDAVHLRLEANRAYAAAARRRAQALGPSVHPVFPHPHPWTAGDSPVPSHAPVNAAASDGGGAPDGQSWSSDSLTEGVPSPDDSPRGAASPDVADADAPHAVDAPLDTGVAAADSGTTRGRLDTAVACTQTEDAVVAPCAPPSKVEAAPQLAAVRMEACVPAVDAASAASGDEQSAVSSCGADDEQAGVCSSASLRTDGSLYEPSAEQMLASVPYQPSVHAQRPQAAAYDARAVLLQRLRLQRRRAWQPAPLLPLPAPTDEDAALNAPASTAQEETELQPDPNAACGSVDGDDDDDEAPSDVLRSLAFATSEVPSATESSSEQLCSPPQSVSPDAQLCSPVTCCSPLQHVMCDAEQVARVTEAVLHALQRGQVAWRDVALDTGDDTVTRLLFDAVVDALSLPPLGASALSASLWQHRMAHLNTPAALDAVRAAVRRFTDAWLAAADADTDDERQRLRRLCALDEEEREWAAAVERETASILSSTTAHVYEEVLLALVRAEAADVTLAEAAAGKAAEATPAGAADGGTREQMGADRALIDLQQLAGGTRTA